MKRICLAVAFFIGFHSIVNGHISIEDINVFIGTGGHGHTHPAATAPFGMIQLGPDTRLDGWDGCSGYHFSDTAIYGFSHTHLSGTGVSDYGDVLFKPVLSLEIAHDNVAIPFSKSDEEASAGYYKVLLQNGVKCEFTAGERIGVHKYSFPKGKRAYIFIDLNHRDQVIEADLKVSGEKTFAGRRYSNAWAKNQKVHFAAKTNLDFNLIKGTIPNTFILDFGKASGPIEIAIGLSGVSEKGALGNLSSDVSDFEAVCKRTENLWQKELDKTQVYGGTDDERTIFTTALYHAYSVPNIWSDADGHYRGMDDKIYLDTIHDHYTVFSLWDTYRTAHPLYTITQKDRTEDFIATMLDQFDQYGRLPVWELAANETNCMIGYHSVSVLADAIAKGYKVDSARVLNAMDVTANASVFGLNAYKKFGFLSIQDESESVSKTLEYAYDDACIAQTALHFGDSALASLYFDRAAAYRSVLEPKTGLARPRDNGGFLKNTNPREVNNHFTEANGWQYSFAAVHDIEGWMLQLGEGNLGKGRRRLESNLDSLFVQNSETTGRDQSDITGLIGQYAHGNEPSHHVAFLYNSTQSPWKTQEKVAEILRSFYKNTPDGLIGNEDCGQMSAWYVMASMGIYPLNPGTPDYVLSTPIWDSVNIALVNGETLNIQMKEKGDYISDFNVNGRYISSNSLSHSTLLKGGDWIVTRSEEPTEWSAEEPYITSIKSSIAPAPVINAPSRFDFEAEISISDPHIPTYSLHTWTKAEELMQFVNGKAIITKSETVYANFRSGTKTGHTSRARLVQKPNAWDAEITLGEPNSQYSAGGDDALVDGIIGDTDWRKGGWIGIQNQDIEILVQSSKIETVNSIKIHFLKDIRSWIGLPAEASVSYFDGEKWQSLETRSTGEIALSQTESNLFSFEWEITSGIRTNKLKIQLKNPGHLENWHPGAGGESFIFIDEIIIH